MYLSNVTCSLGLNGAGDSVKYWIILKWWNRNITHCTVFILFHSVEYNFLIRNKQRSSKGVSVCQRFSLAGLTPFR